MENKKMTSCKTCGTQIAKSAKNCPSCGAKNKKKPIALIIVLVIILVLGGLIISKVMDKNSSNAILTVNGTQYKWSEYRDLYHEYYLNGKAIEFEEEFTPASAEMSGKITQISDAIIGETMNGNMPTKNTLKKFEMTIDDGCTYSVIYKYYEENNYDFSHLAVGDKVTVKGTVTSESLFPTSTINENLDAELKITGTIEGIIKD
ncbi:MAG: zinc ribbon domain-containing protein [Clostridia bacterium]|nr:zinc ribbon domain-containing protein [Clostridia bacterium]